ncbi:MAG: hypothetical protein R2813_08440 [Flavobacteriales bacterium]
MKFLVTATLFVFGVSTMSAQEGLSSKYDEECNCTVIENHNSDGTLSSRHEENAAGQRHGNEVVYFPDGKIQYERNWSHGNLNGIGTHYHPNGQPYMKQHYANGKKKGTWTFYDIDGDVTQEIIYKDGSNDGTYKYYQAGVHYLTQTLVNGVLDSEDILNLEIYNQLKEEAAAALKAGK